jgi:uncharacterized protein
MGDFDWDDGNRDHIARHGVTPDEAEQVYWNDPLDEDYYEVEGEDRFVYIGHTNQMRVLRLVITSVQDL